MNKLDVVKEIRELKNQLAYAKNLGFFFGAGTSCALNIPNIAMLTDQVEKKLAGSSLTSYQTISKDLDSVAKKPNIEDILNQIRRIREITKEDKSKNVLGVTGEAAKLLDREICKCIYEIITSAEEKADLSFPTKFFAWLSALNRDYLKEIFTTNYDLIIEKSLEASQIPYFDGFVGSHEPFFWQESIDKSVGQNDITRNWLRLWKVHGSLSWFWKEDALKKSQKIIRIGKFDKATSADIELVIYPSREKYDSSRKQPFIAYLDRLKNYLLSGELYFIFSGYSFSDQHINDIVFNCLRQNKRLFCVAFLYADSEVEKLHELTLSYMNINVFGPKKVIVNGTLSDWEFNKNDLKEKETFDTYYDEATTALKLGDFRELVTFFLSLSGRADAWTAVPK